MTWSYLRREMRKEKKRGTWNSESREKKREKEGKRERHQS